MKKVLLIISILCLIFTVAVAEDYVANPNEYNTAKINPAGLSYFNNLSLSFVRNWLKNGKTLFFTNTTPIGSYYNITTGKENG